jgi:chromosome partitioning protein
MPARIISIATQKGGVGKTTTAVNLAHALGFKPLSKKVLVVDLDPQANASLILGKTHPDQQPHSVVDIFEDRTRYFANTIVETKYKHIDLIPSNIDLFLCGQRLGSSNPASVLGLQNKLDKATYEKYDYIIIDCPPNLGGPFVVNAMVISHFFIMPIEGSSYFALNGVEQFLESVDAIKQYSNSGLNLLGVIITMYDPRTNASKAMEEIISERFGNKLFDTKIHRNTAIDQANMLLSSIINHDLKASGSKNYRALAKEVCARCDNYDGK